MEVPGQRSQAARYNLVVLDASDVLDDAFTIGCPGIDAESEVSSRCGHFRYFLPQSSEPDLRDQRGDADAEQHEQARD